MNWFRENPFIAGLTAFTVVAAGALIFLLTQAMTSYGDISGQYTAAVQELQKLQNRSPFPNAENLAKTKELEAKYRQELTALQQQLSKLEAPLNAEVRPQVFQDDLRAAVNKVNEKAAAANVALPKDFFLGFQQYVNSPPTDRAAPVLARQLTVISEIVGTLIDVKVQSIDNLVRKPLPEESNVQNLPKPNTVDRFTFDISFTADQSKFRVIFNNIMKSNRFLIVRGVNIANTSQEGPSVAPAGAESNAATAGLPGADNQGSKELPVIFGRELVKVSLRLEMIDFTVPTPEAKK